MKALQETFLPVTQGHTLYVAEFGNPQGIPLLFVHGGPGSGCSPAQAALLMPDTFRIIQFDQRGCGRSTPGGRLLGNRTDALLQDMERLRQHLQIEHWAIYGGSWGATLALEYAKRFPQRVLGLLLRGAFLARQEDWEWFSTPDGVARQFPMAYQTLRQTLQTRQGENPANSLYRHLLNPHTSTEIAYRYALAWDAWEATVMGVPSSSFNPDPASWQAPINRTRVYAYYATHQFFLPEDGVLPGLEAIRHIPTILVHGLHDQVCRFAGAETLAAALPQLQLVPVNGGHGMHERAIQDALKQNPLADVVLRMR
ncbi:alpha/beta fold hydrolase [Candidatus Thiothrix sp. Deng01]|uniref:Proline iminopeptidase n=1 Tax=Candidatus Thiothrix phosphatis TaxID=3112415 RepID=A0ABU6CZN2_9GAMM|nr:alpha/beta fold hydrolase [Candidatus Thiothrix sp. Deng01]MEB4591513.1 alpha/beta fold hydrolase [Candidatus Thiothrix sp. Deng01]